MRNKLEYEKSNICSEKVENRWRRKRRRTFSVWSTEEKIYYKGERIKKIIITNKQRKEKEKEKPKKANERIWTYDLDEDVTETLPGTPVLDALLQPAQQRRVDAHNYFHLCTHTSSKNTNTKKRRNKQNKKKKKKKSNNWML